MRPSRRTATVTIERVSDTSRASSPDEARRNGVRGETLIETMAALHDVADDVGGGEARRQPGNLRGFGLPHRFGGHEALPGPLTRRFGPGGN